MITQDTSNSQETLPAIRALQSKDQWVTWRYVQRDSRMTKIPVNAATLEPASSTDKATWSSYEVARQAYDKSQLNGCVLQGIGYVFNGVETGIDLDHCVRDGWLIDAWAQDIIDRFGSYAEFSPSGTGVHIFVYGIIPSLTGTKKHLDDIPELKDVPHETGAAIEMYSSARYFTITGDHVSGTPTEIIYRQEQISSLYAMLRPEQEEIKRERKGSTEPSATADWSDEKLIDRAMNARNGAKFTALWNGDYEQYYGSQSEADAGLCLMLAFWTGRDFDRIDDLFRQSGLYREKWDRAARSGETYGEGTVWRAIDICEEVYQERTGQEDIEEDDKKKLSQAQLLVKWALDRKVGLFKSTNGTAYGRITIGTHLEIHALHSKSFRDFLKVVFYDYTRGGVPGSQGVQDAINMLEALGGRSGQVEEVFLRVGHKDDKVYIDLCNEAWEAVEISSDGWSILEESPVNFIRTPNMKPLPRPERGGSIEELRPFVNAQDEADWIMDKAWLLGALHPTGPYPHLVLIATRGSGKSSIATKLRSLIDPCVSMLKSGIPEDQRSFTISAKNNWIVAIDNLSRIPYWLSNALCTLATGGGYSARELYTNDEELILDVKRPAILNGIEEFVTATDLLDRSLLVYPKKIEQYVSEEELNERFEEAKPLILGALYDAVAAAKRNRKASKVPGDLRLMDFAKWVAAAEAELCIEPGQFVETYSQSRTDASALALENSPIATAVQKFMNNKTEWTGTATALKSLLESAYSEWPLNKRAANGKVLSDMLFRIATDLRTVGYKVERPKRGSNARGICISRIEQPKEDVEAEPEQQEKAEQYSGPYRFDV